MFAFLIGLAVGGVGALAVYLHQKSSTQSQIDTAIATAVAAAKSVAAKV